MKYAATKWWTGQPERYIDNSRLRVQRHLKGEDVALTTLERSLLAAHIRKYKCLHSR